MTAQDADEMTSIVRFGINNMNLEASPMMEVSESWLTRYSKWTVAPGRFMPRQPSDQRGAQPITWDVRSQELIMPWLSWLDNKCQRLAASQGVNAGTTGKVVKAAQVHFAEAMQQTKFDLYLSNIQQGVKETFRLMISILLKHMNEDPSNQTAYDMETGKSVTITPEQLEKRFRFLPQATSDAISPASRLARQKAISEIATSYWQGLPVFTQQGAAVYWYAINHRLLVLAGERSPERYIGPEPEGSQQSPPVQAIFPPQGPQGDNPLLSLPKPTFSMAEQYGGELTQAGPFMNGAGGG